MSDETFSITFVQGENDPVLLHDLTRIYDVCGYGGKIEADDTLFVAYLSGIAAGGVRLCNEEDVIVLRGMEILPRYRRQGLGLGLLAACKPALSEQTVYCLPYAHLVDFYATVGFSPIDIECAPYFLQARAADYAKTGKKIVAMCRPAKRLGDDVAGAHLTAPSSGKTDTGKIDEVVLALFQLTLHEHFRAWKGFDWGVLNRLFEQGYICDPVNKNKSVALTDEGLVESKRLFQKWFVKGR